MKVVKIVSFILLVIIGYVIFLSVKSHYPVESIGKVKLGIDILEERGFDILQNKTIGILTNQAGVNSKGELTWKILKNAPNVHLKAIFAPVHGLEGKFMSLETFYNDEVDDIPVYSVFASNSRPKDEWLRGLDAVVIDLQGLGIRYYNYWAFMIYMMAACFENDIEVIVLDRPNPLGGNYIGGPAMEAEHTSAWGPIAGLPLFYGLTIGELANYGKNQLEGIVAHKLIETGVPHSGLRISPETLAKGKLTIIPMEGWKRRMLWQDTGLKWIGTSPYISNLQSVYEYALITLGLFVSVNYGFDNCSFLKIEPNWNKSLLFHSFSVKYIVPKLLIAHINEIMCGHTAGFTLSTNSSLKECVDLKVKDIRKVPPGLLGLALLSLARHHTRFYLNSDDNYRFIGAHLGDSELLNKLIQMEEIDVAYFKEKWEKEALQFIEKTRPYRLYEGL
jgi:uncharacterized protein YbbC (DUF1343 family)